MFSNKWFLALKVVPIMLLVGILKFVFHYCGWEPLGINPFFTSLIAATIFLIGFITTGVMNDYKESEKLPGELATSIEALYDEAYIAFLNAQKNSTENFNTIDNFISFHFAFIDSLLAWFYKNERSVFVMNKLSAMNDFFAVFETEKLIQPPFITRMKNEQSNIRKSIIRIHTIRETDFVVSAYAIVELLVLFLIVGMLVIKIEPFYEAVFFTVLVSFVM
ncbi:MAG: hypothetical protein WCJ49_01540, partial [Deltaproteobacteria bacterium]